MRKSVVQNQHNYPAKPDKTSDYQNILFPAIFLQVRRREHKFITFSILMIESFMLPSVESDIDFTVKPTYTSGTRYGRI